MGRPIICFDLDGTLVDERGTIHPRDVETLKQAEREAESEAAFIPCTGRLLPSVRKLFRKHGAFLEGPLPFPLVLQNGAALYGPGEKLVRFRPFPDETRRFLVEVMLNTPGVTFLFFSESQVYDYQPDDFSRRMLKRFDLDAEPFQPEEGVQFSKVMALSEAAERLENVARQTERDEIEQSYSLPTVLELTPAGIHKGRGLGELLEALKFKDRPLLVAGDGGNDLSLFALTPHTFAPSTAPEEIRRQASQVVDVRGEGLLVHLLEAARRLGGRE